MHISTTTLSKHQNHKTENKPEKEKLTAKAYQPFVKETNDRMEQALKKLKIDNI